jgi:hypothetical protein
VSRRMRATSGRRCVFIRRGFPDAHGRQESATHKPRPCPSEQGRTVPALDRSAKEHCLSRCVLPANASSNGANGALRTSPPWPAKAIVGGKTQGAKFEGGLRRGLRC